MKTKGFAPQSGYRLFLIVAIGWLVLSEGICLILPLSRPLKVLNGEWILALWALCFLDLLALAKTAEAVFGVMSFEGEKKSAYLIRTSCWGLIKVVCLGLFGMILLKGHEIPLYGLLLGLGTLGVVPLVGGFIWSQRLLRNA